MIPKNIFPLTRRGFLTVTSLAAAASVGGRIASSQTPVNPTPDSSDSHLAVTGILAEWAAKCAPADVPDAARKEGVRSIVNWIGATVGGSHQPAVDCVLATFAAMGPALGHVYSGAHIT